jgi:membrane dipeptidase
MALTWFDAHLDLGALAVCGRDLTAPLDPSAGPWPPASVTLPSLAQGRVRFALGTIFLEPGGTGPEGYAEGDAEMAYRRGRAQLEAYLTWRDKGLVALDMAQVLRAPAGVGEIRGGMGVAEVVPIPLRERVAKLPGKPALRLGLLIEGADPIRTPAELGWWKSQGVVAVGLAWAKASRYAGGNTTDLGLTEQGRELVREMDRLRVVHDISHLSDRAFRELLERTDRPVIASHSNCRALLGDPSNQRHLTDEGIAAVVQRGGVIGLNLFSKFLRAGLGEQGRASIGDCVAHVQHVCEIAGDRRHVGLGSDMDGGFGASRLPEGIDTPAGLSRLAEGLRDAGWSDDEVRGFAWENWARFWGG